MQHLIKICGIRNAETLATVIEYGADFAGFVHCPASPRHVTLAEIAPLVAQAKTHVHSVILLVNPDDDVLTQVQKIAPTYIQLHGDESPARVSEIQAKFGLKTIKAIGISEPRDLEKLRFYRNIDLFLLDAKPPKDATRTGGHGMAFDWSILSNIDFEIPYLLAGGLTPENVQQALRLTRAPGVDVSSGVESTPGIKNAIKIQSFIDAVRQLDEK